MIKVRRYARKIKIAAFLLAILVICGIIGQMNVRKKLVDVCPDALPWSFEGNSAGLDVHTDEITEGNFTLSSSFVTLEFDYEIYDVVDIPSDGNLHIEIISAASPENILLWEFVPGTLESSGHVQIDLKAFKGQEIQIRISCKGDFAQGGIRLENLKLSKLYVGA